VKTPIFDLALCALLIWLGVTRYQEGERAWGGSLVLVAVVSAVCSVLTLAGRGHG
jgi:hypothetical protein